MPKARGSSAVGAARDKGAILSRVRMAPSDPREHKGLCPLTPPLRGLGLKSCSACGIGCLLFFCCDTIWLAPIIRCRSAHLVEVQPNFCLLWICTILLMPAKAALLRSPHFNRKNDRVSGRFRSFYQFVPEDNRR